MVTVAKKTLGYLATARYRGFDKGRQTLKIDAHNYVLRSIHYILHALVQWLLAD